MLEPAKKEVEFALKLDPLDFSANHAMALVEVQLDQISEAEQRFLQAIESDSQNRTARNSFGRLLCERGRGGCATGVIRQYWGVLENSFNQQAYISELTLESVTPAPETGIMPVFA